MRIIFFTDVHLSEGIDSLEGFDRALEAFEQEAPDLMIFGGDMGLEPSTVPEYEKRIEQSTIPVIFCYGNHELENGFLTVDQIGRNSSFHQLPGVNIMVVDAWRHQQPDPATPLVNWFEIIDDSQLDWMQEQLAGVARDEPLLVVTHCPWKTAVDLGKFDGYDLCNAGKALALIRDFKHVKVLSGHLHETARIYDGDIEMIMTNAVCGWWWENGIMSTSTDGSPPGYRLIEIAGTGEITTIFKPLFDEGFGEVGLFTTVANQTCLNVYDGSARTKVFLDGERLSQIKLTDRIHGVRIDHFWLLPEERLGTELRITIEYENGRALTATLPADHQPWKPY